MQTGSAIEHDPFRHKLAALVLPIVCQQFMLALVSASDALMLGMIAQEPMAAVSLATQVTFVQNLFLAAITIGLSVLAAQYWGKGDISAVERLFASVLKWTSAVSFAFFLAALVFPHGLMRLFTNDTVLIADGAQYLHAVSPSYLFSGVSQIYLCIFKNTGRAKLAGAVGSASVAANIVLNAILIFGLYGAPALGIEGAALATDAAKLMELLWCMAAMAGDTRVHLRAAYLRRNDAALCRRFWQYTAPVLGNETVWGLGFTMYSVIMGHLGSDAVAANSIASIVKNLAACFCLGLSSGGGILVGNELGAGHPEQARAYGARLCRLAIVCGALSGAALLAAGPLVLRAADLSETAAGYLRWMLVICSYYMIGKSVNTVTISGIFCAGGDSRFGLLCDFITMWCITVPLGFLAAFWLKLPVAAVYCIISLDEIVKLPAVYRHYKQYRWVKDLTAREEPQ